MVVQCGHNYFFPTVLTTIDEIIDNDNNNDDGNKSSLVLMKLLLLLFFFCIIQSINSNFPYAFINSNRHVVVNRIQSILISKGKFW